MKSIKCLVCKGELTISAAQGRKSKKPFVMLKCSQDGRHFRAFITDQEYVKKVMAGVENPSGNGALDERRP